MSIFNIKYTEVKEFIYWWNSKVFLMSLVLFMVKV
jgi:hypothetical protein